MRLRTLSTAQFLRASAGLMSSVLPPEDISCIWGLVRETLLTQAAEEDMTLVHLSLYLFATQVRYATPVDSGAAHGDPFHQVAEPPDQLAQRAELVRLCGSPASRMVVQKELRRTVSG